MQIEADYWLNLFIYSGNVFVESDFVALKCRSRVFALNPQDLLNIKKTSIEACFFVLNSIANNRSRAVYKLNPIISPMPAVSSPRPTRERAVNFSFIISHDKNIVKRMESLPMQLTATGFAPPQLSE